MNVRIATIFKKNVWTPLKCICHNRVSLVRSQLTKDHSSETRDNSNCQEAAETSNCKDRLWIGPTELENHPEYNGGDL